MWGMMHADEVEDLAIRVHDAPDLGARAAILDLDLDAVRGASRRFIVSTWSLGILVALAVSVLPTARFFGQVSGHSVEAYERMWIGNFVLGGLSAFALLAVSGGVLGTLRMLLARWLPTQQNARFVLVDLAAAILVPSVAAVAWLWGGSLPLFAYGSIAAVALAAMPHPAKYDFVGALKANKPRIGAAVARQQAAGTPMTLVGGHSRWLALQVAGNIVGAPFALILILTNPWAAIAVIVAYFAQRTQALLFEFRGRYRTAVLVHLAIALALAAAALIVSAGYFWPHVQWIAPGVPV